MTSKTTTHKDKKNAAPGEDTTQAANFEMSPEQAERINSHPLKVIVCEQDGNRATWHDPKNRAVVCTIEKDCFTVTKEATGYQEKFGLNEFENALDAAFAQVESSQN